MPIPPQERKLYTSVTYPGGVRRPVKEATDRLGCHACPATIESVTQNHSLHTVTVNIDCSNVPPERPCAKIQPRR